MHKIVVWDILLLKQRKTRKTKSFLNNLNKINFSLYLATGPGVAGAKGIFGVVLWSFDPVNLLNLFV